MQSKFSLDKSLDLDCYGSICYEAMTDCSVLEHPLLKEIVINSHSVKATFPRLSRT